MLIHPDVPNDSSVGTGARGTTTRFKPWGNDFNRCIQYNPGTTHVEYRFDCVEQYAIHEFGHVLGFAHEWNHPDTPASCSDRTPLPSGSYDDTFPTTRDAVVVSPHYDFTSIMTYGNDACVDQHGVRFGSTRLSPADIVGVSTVYRPASGLGPNVCNPGWLDAQRWSCAANRLVATGGSCASGWVPCTPGCNPGRFAETSWTCPGYPYLATGRSCPTGWKLCGSD